MRKPRPSFSLSLTKKTPYFEQVFGELIHSYLELFAVPAANFSTITFSRVCPGFTFGVFDPSCSLYVCIVNGRRIPFFVERSAILNPLSLTTSF